MQTNNAKLEAIAEQAWEWAQEDARDLRQIRQLLDAGDDQGALGAMKTYLNFKKPNQKVLYDRPKKAAN